MEAERCKGRIFTPQRAAQKRNRRSLICNAASDDTRRHVTVVKCSRHHQQNQVKGWIEPCSTICQMWVNAVLMPDLISAAEKPSHWWRWLIWEAKHQVTALLRLAQYFPAHSFFSDPSVTSVESLASLLSFILFLHLSPLVTVHFCRSCPLYQGTCLFRVKWQKWYESWAAFLSSLPPG